MIYNNLNLPATLVHSVNGKKYTLNGKLLSINESTKLATMQFGDKTNSNIPLNEVYLNEGALKDMIKKTGKKIKDAAKKTWEKIKGVLSLIGGFLIPVDEDGNELTEFINSPINYPLMDLPESIKIVPSDKTLQLCAACGGDIINACTIDEAFADSIAREKAEIETYWTRVMREYAKPENESLTLSETVKMVNETYYHETTNSKALNETVSLYSGNTQYYGKNVNTASLKRLIKRNIVNQITEADDKDFSLLIWGAPGIGKTAIIKSAAKEIKKQKGYNLDMVVVACGGLHNDDFDLPDTAYNVADEKIAVGAPQTWLPVFSKNGLTPEEIEWKNEFYNSGKFRIRKKPDDKNHILNRVSKDGEGQTIPTVDWKSLPGESFDGGILFFDELARIADPQTVTIMMNLMGDRIYKDMEIASKWSLISAANRLSDNNTSEVNKEFFEIWDVAKYNRFTMLNYVPTKKEWLEWAREVDEEGGVQHVDELICKFIESTEGDAVWYDAFGNGSRGDIKDANIKRIAGDWDSGANLPIEDIKNMGTWISNPTNAVFLGSRLTWNGRTWHKKIGNAIRKLLKNEIFADYPEKYQACFSPIIQTRKSPDGFGTEEYTALTLNQNNIEKQLNSLPADVWYELTADYEQLDPNGNFRKNDRLGMFMKMVQEIIEIETGDDSLPSTSWQTYNNVDAIISRDDIKAIYNTGAMKDAKMRKADNILFGTQFDYTSNMDIAWKSNANGISKVVMRVLDAFDDNIKPNQVLSDIEAITKNAERYEVTPAEVERYRNEYTLHLTDANGKEIRTIPTLLAHDSILDENLEESIVHVLKNSKVAKKMANLAFWIAKITIQSTNAPLVVALGGDDENGVNYMAEGTIVWRFTQMINKDPQLAKAYSDTEIIRKYGLFGPALNILETIKEYYDDELQNNH